MHCFSFAILTTTHLHIVSFDVPYPPNYGGIIDVFYKLKYLQKAGIKLIFHCFYYKGHNPPTANLDAYCEKVYYYPRKRKIAQSFLGKLPYIVSSRSNKKLLDNLLKDDYPILFEGLHTCYFLNHPELKKRKRLVRAHNVEHHYYAELVKIEKNGLKRAYLNREAKRLQRFEHQLKGATGILSIAKMDVDHFSQYAPTIHIPPFFDGGFNPDFFTDEWVHQVVFHGNLSVPENEAAALFILTKVAPLIPFAVVIAGKSPSQRLLTAANQVKNGSVIASPSVLEMDELIQQSQVSLLFTHQQTGVKLKLFHALKMGRHVIINSKMNDADVFSPFCHIANTAEEIAKKIETLMVTPFTEADKKKRDASFAVIFDGTANARRILDLLT